MTGPRCGAPCPTALAIGWALALAVAPVRVAGAQQPAPAACNATVDDAPRGGSPVAHLHPSRVERRYATEVAARHWLPVLERLEQEIATTLEGLQQSPDSSPQFRAVQQSLRESLEDVLDSLPAALEVRLAQRAAALQPLAITRFEPAMPPVGGDWVILQTEAQPRGVPVPAALRPAEYEAICWGSRSVSRVLNGVNYETVPGALAHITDLAREWERYRTKGPMQLPHELLANRVLRWIVPVRGDARFHPPRVDLVLAHPFAGVEVARREGGVEPRESLATEVGGLTLWMADWTRLVGVSWVLAYDRDGRIGRGPLVRLGGYATGGVLWRRDATGERRASALATVDVLRLLRPDAAAQAERQVRGIAGDLLAGVTRR